MFTQNYLHAMDNWHFINVPVNLTEIKKTTNFTFRPDDAFGIIVILILNIILIMFIIFLYFLKNRLLQINL